VTPAFDKTALRLRMRGLRRRLAAETPMAAEHAADALPLDRLPAFASFSLYFPHGTEIDPRPLGRRLEETGATPLLPVALSHSTALIFRVFDPAVALEPDVVGVPAPPASAAERTPQLIVAPLLAFDRRGGRLGQGGGHFDRTLENLRSGGRVFVLGLAYAGQEVDEIPMEPHDQRLDAILTETGYRTVEQD
jgi:5-formyltetrahydrofolate cyclo-ligase